MLTFDNALIVQSRLISLDTILLLATFGSLSAYVASLKEVRSIRRSGFIILAGVLVGLAAGASGVWYYVPMCVARDVPVQRGVFVEQDSRAQCGGIVVMTLVFVFMFTTIFMSLTGLVTRQYREAVLQAHDELAFQVAEVGLNYGRWRLAHERENFAPQTRTVTDQLSGAIGTYDLTFVAPSAGSTTVTIESTGRTTSKPLRTVKLRARYGIPSLTKNVFITNSDVWYGGAVRGNVHANGGIRMDGQSDSLVQSAKATYICGPVHGCNNQEKPGVWGSGQKQELWEFPVPVVDYNAITVSLLEMKTAAEQTGTYYGPSSVFGYHLVFEPDGRYSISKVTQKTKNIWSYDATTGWEYSSYDIKREEFLERKAVPAEGVIYIEDTAWINGDVRSRVTVAAGRFPDLPSTNADIIINADITYGGVVDGSRVLGVVAQRNILIPYESAKTILTLEGAFLAQKGKYGRRYYDQGPHKLKEKIKIYGMIGSNLVPVTAWVDGSGAVRSGYRQGESVYDPHLLYGPPPYFPGSGQYQFISWEQVE